ncbi:MAG: glucose-6-phosphate isomerase [Stenotrophobium sp.]
MSKLTNSPAWQALQAHSHAMQSATIADLFAADSQRAQAFSCDAVGLHLDYSKQRATASTRALLIKLAEQQRLSQWIRRLFAGDEVNNTEHRAAGHAALRAPRGAAVQIGGENVAPAVHAVLDRMCGFAEQVRDGQWRGYSDKRITDLVNIGIGGSDLGPRMVCDALSPVADGPRAHFVANVDGVQIAELLKTLNPETTLWVVTSKTFTTQETMANAGAARDWLLRSADEAAIARHFVAVSTNLAETRKFGIAESNIFGFWDWVGGRYSLWSAVGLSIVIAIGPQRFRELLAGAHAMDQHFREAPLQQNLPVLMGLLGVWNNNFLGCASHYIAPYAQKLVHFTAWLQQLEMESNGKGVDRDGHPVDYSTTPSLWGDVGTNGQHAFFQMLHQGPAVHSVDFILPVAAEHTLTDQHRMLVANCLAQSAALMLGKTAEQVSAELQVRGLSGIALAAAIPPRVFSGNRPSNTLLLPRLDPYHLGALLALYEHRTFVQSVIWNINPFDQWGVELGKQLAQNVLSLMNGAQTTELDGSTQALLHRVR